MIVHPVGRRALLLEVGGRAAVRALQEAVGALVAAGELPAPVDVVPGARTLLLDGVDVELARRRLAGDDGSPDRAETDRAPGPLVELPVVYDGADLAAVAELWGLSEQQVVELHLATEFTVAFCGFAPGFPYLVGLDREVPRRPSPRPAVPAGSVGLAGRYCGIYPASSPGGWQLVATTAVPLFDPDRDPPALLPPGTRVRFVRTVRSSGAPPSVGRPRAEPEPAAVAARALTVVRAGAMTTLQDRGRAGLAAVGVPRAGAVDAAAAALANRLVANPGDAAVLETTGSGVALRASAALTVAVTGAQAPVTVDGRSASWGVCLGLPAGSVLDVGTATAGLRSYVAVAGGLAVPGVLGSRSRDTLSGLGPAVLRDGDLLPVGDARGLPPPVEFTVPEPVPDLVVLHLLPGPRDDWFGDAGLAALLSASYAVSPLSNRVGVRLAGPAVPRVRTEELESEGMVLGGVQVPPDGQPVVLLADHPTTGGYPVIGVVDPGDLGRLAQSRPGTPVRFALAGPSGPARR